MALFEKQLSEIREYLRSREGGPGYREYRHAAEIAWPSGMKRNVVLAQDTAVELGNPREESSSCLIWHDDPGSVRDGVITLIGPELAECAGQSVPFGKVVIIGVSGFNAENSYDRYREMDSVRYEMDLKGYMMRAVSQFQREWSRVSREAVDSGFSFPVLGGALIDAYRRKEYVRSVEVLFVTSSREDVRGLVPVSDGAMRIIAAMNKMFEELDYDCGTCENTEVCGEVEDLRTMRDGLRKKKEMKNVQ
jgi:CO dehydrogenase/acetyl-CoA synthase beta subunit